MLSILRYLCCMQGLEPTPTPSPHQTDHKPSRQHMNTTK